MTGDEEVGEEVNIRSSSLMRGAAPSADVEEEAAVEGDHVMGSMTILTSAERRSKEEEAKSCCCWSKPRNNSFTYDSLDPKQKLFVDEKTLKRALYILRLGIFTDAVVGTIEQPNYPIMVLPGAHPDSFPDTGGLGFGAAQYFVPMSALLGISIACMVIGTLSDKVGRKPCILLCLYGTVCGSILKYFLRFGFWPYCAANFLNGLVSGTVPVALAYVSDVFRKKRDKEEEIGLLVGFNMLGTSGGGMIAILMETQGLFAPLLVGAGLVAISAVLCTFMLIEPSKDLKEPVAFGDADGEGEGDENDDDSEMMKPPEKLDHPTLWTIVIGALGDNIGSAGLMPLALSPLAFNVFYTSFLEGGPNYSPGVSPIMSQVAYKWISVLVALMVVPGTLVSTTVFNKIGTAGGCILGNAITGIVTIVLLYIALAPPTTITFGVFVALLYVFFPFTVISQLSTGPMLDVIAPVDKRGLVQGINITVMNIGAAVSPFLLGMLSDVAGTPIAIWTCIGISFLAAIINIPLMWKKGLGIPPKKLKADSKPLKGEDKEVVERALRGEWVPPDIIEAINNERREKGQPYLVTHAGSYEEDRTTLLELRSRAKADFLWHRRTTMRYLEEIKNTENLPALCESVNTAINSADPEQVARSKTALGEWFVAYLSDAGYLPHTDAPLFKQMIMSAFPVVNEDKEIRADNLEQILLSTERLYNRFSDIEPSDEGRGPFDKYAVLSNARSAMLQQTI